MPARASARVQAEHSGGGEWCTEPSACVGLYLKFCHSLVGVDREGPRGVQYDPRVQALRIEVFPLSCLGEGRDNLMGNAEQKE